VPEDVSRANLFDFQQLAEIGDKYYTIQLAAAIRRGWTVPILCIWVLNVIFELVFVCENPGADSETPRIRYSVFPERNFVYNFNCFSRNIG
jgi:hypothetical protein